MPYVLVMYVDSMRRFDDGSNWKLRIAQRRRDGIGCWPEALGHGRRCTADRFVAHCTVAFLDF